MSFIINTIMKNPEESTKTTKAFIRNQPGDFNTQSIQSLRTDRRGRERTELQQSTKHKRSVRNDRLVK